MFEIRMNHPSKNALDHDLMGWLETRLDEAGGQPILLTGSQDAFCAGLNLREVASLDRQGMEKFLRRIDALATRLYEHPAPSVACINGHAIAGGCILALCCDFRIAKADPKIRIGVNEVALGACYPPAILKIVMRRVAPQWHERVMLGASLFSPQDALAIGLIDEIAEDVEGAAKKRLESLSAHPRGTYARTKALIRRDVSAVSAADERRFCDEELAIWTSPEVKARVTAVLAR